MSSATLPRPAATGAFDAAAYASDGVVVVPSFFECADADALRDGWQRLAAEDVAQQGLERSARFLLGTLPGPIGRLYAHPRLVALATSVLGRDVGLYMNRILIKDQTWGGAVAIHQDMPYFTGGQDKLSIFVPLRPTAAHNGNGGLAFVRGSHRYGALSRGTVDRTQFEPMEDVAPSLEVGDIVAMNFLTWHYSENAVVADERPLMQIVYQPATDGSYGGPKLGVVQPTLVAGEWKTRHFAEWNRGVQPDGQ
jgi:hypothetical protein